MFFFGPRSSLSRSEYSVNGSTDLFSRPLHISRTLFLKTVSFNQTTDFTANDVQYRRKTEKSLTSTLSGLGFSLYNKLTLNVKFSDFTLTWNAPHKIKLESKQIDTKNRSWNELETKSPSVGAPSIRAIILNGIFVSPFIL